MDSQPLLTPNI